MRVQPYRWQGRRRSARFLLEWAWAHHGSRLSAGGTGEEDDAEVAFFLCQLGADGPTYRRERRKQLRHMVSEVYSPPRVTKAASDLPGFGILPGFAMDLTCIDEADNLPWDFDLRVKRERAQERLDREQQLWLVVSPMCTAFSS